MLPAFLLRVTSQGVDGTLKMRFYASPPYLIYQMHGQPFTALPQREGIAIEASRVLVDGLVYRFCHTLGQLFDNELGSGVLRMIIQPRRHTTFFDHRTSDASNLRRQEENADHPFSGNVQARA